MRAVASDSASIVEMVPPTMQTAYIVDGVRPSIVTQSNIVSLPRTSAGSAADVRWFAADVHGTAQTNSPIAAARRNTYDPLP